MNSHFDAGAYRWVTDLAHRAPQSLDDAVRYFSDYGLGVFAVFMLLAWWQARPAGSARMAAALSVPVIVVAAYAVNDVLKSLVDEQRPCRTLHTATVEACPALGDWSFPSNHSAIAGAAAVALLIAAGRRIGAWALALALLMAASRVWIGVHYPHDVVVGFLTGAVVAWPLAPAARRAAPAVDRLRATRLRPLLATASVPGAPGTTPDAPVGAKSGPSAG